MKFEKPVVVFFYITVSLCCVFVFNPQLSAAGQYVSRGRLIRETYWTATDNLLEANRTISNFLDSV